MPASCRPSSAGRGGLELILFQAEVHRVRISGSVNDREVMSFVECALRVAVLHTVDGAFEGAPSSASVTSMVWYSPSEFKDAVDV